MTVPFRRVGVIGFGEAGPVFAGGLLAAGVAEVAAYDILQDDPGRGDAQRAKTTDAGVRPADTAAEAARGAELVISTVTADQTVPAAAAAARGLAAGQIYLDLNSTSPRVKAEAAACVQASGARFIEGVAMDTIPNFGIRVPLLVAGEGAGELAATLSAIGLRVQSVGEKLGAASSAKMLRSVLIKGFGALFGESMLAASRLGLEETVIASLYETFPGLDWRKEIGYYLSRSSIHARRQAAEMRASAETVADLGVEPLMTRAIAERLQWAADLGLPDIYEAGDEPTVDDFVRAVMTARSSS